MDWDDFRFFLALAREGTVSGAGRALGVKHTTVARRVQSLENRLGARLFDRLPGGYAMTQAAENMFPHVLEMESRAQTVDREVFGQDAELAGLLKLTVAHDLANRLITPKLPAFTDLYPRIDLQLITTTGLVDLAAREADIAVRLTPKPPDYLVGREVMKMGHGVYGSAESLASLPDPVPVVLFRSESERPDWVKRNFPRARVALRVDDVSSMAAAVRHGLGLARMPCYIGDSDPELRRMEADLMPSTWGVWILSHVDLRATARVRVCREFLLEVLEDQRSLIQGQESNFHPAR